MSLLQNVTRRAQYPIRSVGGASASPLQRTELGLNQFSLLSPFASDAGWDDTVSFPAGWRYGNGWQPSQSDSTYWAANIGAATADVTWTLGTLNVAAGMALAGAVTVTWTLPDAQLQLVVSADGSCTVTWTTAGNVAGSLAAEGATTVTFTLGTPTLGAVAEMTGPTSVTFSLAGLIRATGALAGDITPFTELSPESLANAVANLAIDGDYSLREVLRVLVAVAAGLDTVTDLGGGETEVVFRDLSDLLDRVTATLTGEERTAVVLDVS